MKISICELFWQPAQIPKPIYISVFSKETDYLPFEITKFFQSCENAGLITKWTDTPVLLENDHKLWMITKNEFFEISHQINWHPTSSWWYLENRNIKLCW